MHTTFPISSTIAIVSQLHIGEDGKVLMPYIARWVENQYLGPPEVEDIEDSSSDTEVVRHKTTREDQEGNSINCPKGSIVLWTIY